MVKVVWTTAALEDLDNIGEFIGKDSLKYSAITVEDLFYSVDILEKHPNAGVKVPEFGNESIRQLISVCPESQMVLIYFKYRTRINDF